MIQGLSSDGAMPVLEAMIRFAGTRQRLIAHNVANIDTPDFRVIDADPRNFQKALGKAVERRRARGGSGSLDPQDTPEIKFSPDGSIELNPRSFGAGILYHDRNNRDLERLMQANAENVAAFRVATDLLKSRTDLLRAAIAERA